MFKRIFCVLLCLAALFLLCFCSTNDKVEENPDNQKEEVVEQNDKEATGNNGFVNVELNIKPLEETETETLAQSATSLGFKNEKLFHAFANAIGKKPADVTQEDVDKVHYIAIGTEKEEGFSIYVGHINYVDLCLSDKVNEPDFASMLSNALMMSEFEYNIETDSLYDLGNFKNIEMFEIYDVKIEDVSFVNNYTKLIYGFFKNNSITDVSSLAHFNPETLIELDFTGNEIADFSFIEHIKQKVLVFFDLNSGMKITLEDFLEQQKNPVVVPETPVEVEEPKQEKENETENNETGFVIVDQNGNKADFSTLFD